MEQNIKFSRNVVLIDTAFLNEVAYHARQFFARQLGRTIPHLDLPAWLTYLSLDAGIRTGDHEIQVLLVHGEGVRTLNGCEPSELERLNGQACRTEVGEFLFSSVSSAGLVSDSALFLDLMNLALDSADVECLMLLPFHPAYGALVKEGLEKFFEKKEEKERGKAVYFVMEQPVGAMPCRWDLVIFSLARAFGIRAEEMR